MQQKDATTGSFPSVVRIASDNRTGEYQVQYDDLNTIGFGETENILDNVISYWRFNSGSSDEVTPINLSTPSASYRINPVFLNDSVKEQDIVKHLYYRSAQPPAFGHFSSGVPFAGPSDDTNPTSLCLYPGDLSVLSGNLALFNPGSETIVSGAKEKEFTIAFWVNCLSDFSPPNSLQSVISVAEAGAVSQPLGIITGSILNVERVRNAEHNNLFRMVIVDPNNNGIGVTASTPISGNIWHHYAFTYDGTKDFDSLKVYLDGQLVGQGNVFQGTLNAYSGMTSSLSDHQVYMSRLANDTNLQFDGFLDEVIFLDKALPEPTIKEIYNFTRTISKAKENPLTGIYYGLGLPTNSKFIKHPTEQTSSLFGTGKVVKGIGDSAATFTPGQSLQPFRDLNLPAVDGKSTGNKFYATGSRVEDIGEGFNQPLWSKTKIEIDISTVAPQTIGYRSGSNVGGDDYAMMYYNAGTKTYMPIGSRKRWDEYENSSGAQYENFISEKAIGFLPAINIVAAGPETRYLNQTPTSMFGFPYDKKYFVDPKHDISSSILIPVSNYINEPFLIEKIVVLFSCSHFARDWQANAGAGLAGHAINTFFVLNQKKAGRIQTELQLSGSDFPITNRNINFTRQVTHRSGAMDLVTFSQFMLVSDTEAHATGAFPDNSYLQTQLSKEIKPIFVRDIYPGDTQFKFTGSLELSGTVKSAAATMLNQYNSLEELPFTYDTVPVPSGNNSTGTVSIKSTGFTGGRNGILTKPNPRNYRRVFEGITNTKIQLLAGGTAEAPELFLRNPYLLQPGDQLIFGWQCAYPITEHGIMRNPFPFMPAPVYIGPELTINEGSAKVILYGSKIVNGREAHDTLNQLLTSETVHEVIGND